MKQSGCSFSLQIQGLVLLSVGGVLGCTASVVENDPSVEEPVAELEQASIPGATVTRVYKRYALPANGLVVNQPSPCPSGSVVVGGGYFAGSQTRVYSSGINLNSWTASAHNLSSSQADELQVYAQCLSGTSATTGTAAPGTIYLAKNGGTGCAEAQCPDGKLLTGGGYTAGAMFRPTTNSLVAGRRWRVCGRNEHPTESQIVSVYPVCVGGVTGVVGRRASSGTVPAASSKTLTTSACPSGDLLGSGGYTGPEFGLYASATGRNELDAAKWSTTFVNLTNSTQSATVTAGCLTLWP